MAAPAVIERTLSHREDVPDQDRIKISRWPHLPDRSPLKVALQYNAPSPGIAIANTSLDHGRTRPCGGWRYAQCPEPETAFDCTLRLTKGFAGSRRCRNLLSGVCIGPDNCDVTQLRDSSSRGLYWNLQHHPTVNLYLCNGCLVWRPSKPFHYLLRHAVWPLPRLERLV